MISIHSEQIKNSGGQKTEPCGTPKSTLKDGRISALNENFLSLSKLEISSKKDNEKPLGDLYIPYNSNYAFWQLPNIAQLMIMRLVFVDVAIPEAVVRQWLQVSSSKLFDEISRTLTGLKIWTKTVVSGGNPGIILNQIFKKHLRVSLIGGTLENTRVNSGIPTSISSVEEVDTKPRDIPYLDSYATERWNAVLQYIVSIEKSKECGTSTDAAKILHHAGLMNRIELQRPGVQGGTYHLRYHKTNDKGELEVTRDGFQFLLMDTNSQVWYFILQYLESLEERKQDLVECLSFLFQLSFTTLGKDYCTRNMNDKIAEFIQHLREFGLLFQRKRKDGRFYPTRLALSVIPGASSHRLEMENQSYMIVESNYRLTAYTDSELQIALISLFAEPMYRLPGTLFSVITRDSVREALKHGITAAQIIAFIKSHAYRDKMRDDPAINPVVADQIRLWELERERLTSQEGVLYNQFLSAPDFELLRNYAKQINVLVWESEPRRTIIVTKEGHDEVKKFWKRINIKKDR
nr:EOG090X04KD [Artemia franciscana]